MTKQLQCIKIKDGLYLGNIRTAQDIEFLITNKIHFIVNCSSQIPNFYQPNLHYLKFKLQKDKTHNLWQNDSLSKLNKLHTFIQSAQQQSLCCLIHSFDGYNRSLVFLTAYLMTKYLWTLSKALQYIRSKKVFIGLSQHNIEQLQKLQQIMSAQNQLTSSWKCKYTSIEQQIISKTFLNSQLEENYQNILSNKKKNQKIAKDNQELKLKQKIISSNILVPQKKIDFQLKDSLKKQDLSSLGNQKKQKIKKKVMWLDKIQKQRKKNERKYSQIKNNNNNQIIQYQKKERNQNLKSLKDFVNKKIEKNISTMNGVKSKNIKQSSIPKKSYQNFEINSKTQKLINKLEYLKRQEDKSGFKRQEQIIKMIKSNLKFNKTKINQEKQKNVSNNSHTKSLEKQLKNEKQKKANIHQKVNYNLNFFNCAQPNINIINNFIDTDNQIKKKNYQRPKSACQKPNNKKQKQMKQFLDLKQLKQLKALIKQKKDSTKKKSPQSKQKKINKSSSYQSKKMK